MALLNELDLRFNALCVLGERTIIYVTMPNSALVRDAPFTCMLGFLLDRVVRGLSVFSPNSGSSTSVSFVSICYFGGVDVLLLILWDYAITLTKS